MNAFLGIVCLSISLHPELLENGDLKLILEKQITSEIYNVVAPNHPNKHQVYTSKAKEFGIEEPQFLEGGKNGKVVISDKLIQSLNYRFKYPNPMK